ncbi:hypothetical protein HYX08_04860 [Candidatus Woesearchaeota archaeon]|nr:hypothetical protein [Candidatus Woesearchaeota archaeon]
MPNEIEKQYDELKKKLKLPDFKEIDFEFEISDIEETNFLLREIIRRICERLDFYSTMLEGILQPDTSNLYAMHETRYFTEDEKNNMYKVYSRLMELNRQSIEISLQRNGNEGLEADFISKFLIEWKTIKKGLLSFVKKMKESWQNEVDIKENVGYLG